MPLSSWLHWLARGLRPNGTRTRRVPPTARRRRPRLHLEQLEDRMLPSTFYAASVSDLVADINAANNQGGSNTIYLTAATTSPYVLTAANNTTDGANGLPVIAMKDTLTIIGNGDTIERSTASGTPAFRLLDVAPHGSLTVQNVTLQGGLAFGSGIAADGGAILNQGTLTLTAATVQDNAARGFDGANALQFNGNGDDGQAAAGGGIWSNGALTLQGGTTLQANSAIGGRGGDAGWITNASYAQVFGKGRGGNGGTGSGGGVYVAGGTATLDHASLLSNTAQGGVGGAAGRQYRNSLPGTPGNGFGGGLFVAAGTVSLCTDTVASNTAVGANVGFPGSGQGAGGGLYTASGASVYIDAFTVANALNNTDNSGTNGSTANIDGAYIVQAC
jgi:hypothetical protein